MEILCKEHNLPYKFICCISNWHCEQLCEKCISIHNEHHLLNKKQMNIKLKNELYNESISNIKKNCEIIQEKKNSFYKFENIVKNNNFNENINIINLNNIKNNTLKIINEYFNNIENEIKEYYFEKNKDLFNTYMKIQNKLDEDLLKNQNILTEITENNDNIIKIIKFSENIDFFRYEDLNITLKLLKAIPNEIFSDLIINNIVEIPSILKKNIYFKENIISKKKNKDLNAVQINKCKKCGSTMKFISDFKKHLSCEFCNNIKRLYFKKNS